MRPAQRPMQVTEFTFNFSPDLYNNPFSASSSSSRPSSTTRYFDLLPPELIRHIFDFIQPASIVPIPAQHAKSQKTFRILCLLSKRFLELAQPYLFAILCMPAPRLPGTRITARSDLDPTLSKAIGTPSKIEINLRTLFLDLKPTKRNRDALRILVKSVERLENLIYVTYVAQEPGNRPEAKISPFSCFEPFLGSNLKTLHLEYVTIPHGTIFAWPRLQELSLHHVRLPPRLKIVYRLPSLVHIVYSSMNPSPQLDALHVVLASAPRLASISLALHYGTTPECVYNPPHLDVPSVLFVFPATASGLHFLPGAKYRHLRITFEPNFAQLKPQAEDSRTSILTQSVRAIEGLSEPQHLRTLYLPEDLSPQRQNLTDEMREQVLKMIGFCAKNDVELVWEGITTDYHSERLVSREFADRAEQRKGATESEGWKKAGFA